uniref:Peptidase M41 domain-containing protein n=1 Tax=Brassica oleracea var. oleracea TaxID=109376 RepID=A0A0D2ZU20_BRAOL
MSFASHLQATNLMVVGAKSPVDRRRKALKRVNKELSRGKYETALSLVKQLKGKHGCLSAFASAKLLPKKSPVLDTLGGLIDSVSRSFESVSAEANSVRNFQEHKAITSPSEEDWFAVVQHESGHFLVGYLLGVLPRRYEIPNLEAMRDNVASVTGRVEFVGFEFLKQVGAANQFMKDDVDLSVCQGYISSKTLNNFSCVILGGMVTEHMLFGYSEGFYSDVVKVMSSQNVLLICREINFLCFIKKSDFAVEQCSAMARVHRNGKGGSYQMGCFQHCIFVTFIQ